MVNGFGKIINLNIPKIDLGLSAGIRPIALFKPIDKIIFRDIELGPSFVTTSKQGKIPPLKPQANVEFQTQKIASLETRADESLATQRRVREIINGGLALQQSGLAKPTASKVRANLRNRQKGLLNRVQGSGSLGNREFQVAFENDAGVMQVRTFRDRDEAAAFRATLEASGLLTDVSLPREVRV